jgi:PhoH-like ATPase
MRKNYILDANILLHDPYSIFQFADNTIIIPIEVICEIDRFKKERTDRGYNARLVVRLLDGLRSQRNLREGVTLESGGLLRVDYLDDHESNGRKGQADAEILRLARRTQESEPDTPVIIVTKDVNLRIRADAAGFRAEDYESDRVNLASLRTGNVDLTVSSEQFAQFEQDGVLTLPNDELSPNEYVLLRPPPGERGSVLARADGRENAIHALLSPDDALWGVRPRNKEQYFAADALLDAKIHLVTLMGKAGTGKTLLAIAAAMHQTLNLNRYRGFLVCRPVVPLGRDLGYLPGDLERKLDPWMKPITDTVDFLFDKGGAPRDYKDYDSLIRGGRLEIQPLTYIRGRSISNHFVVIDEAQNLTPLEVKTVITRMGLGAKVVLTGDAYQIDNPYVDGNSNGFTYLVNRFRSESLAAHVELRKGERSTLAELAANLL